MLFSHQTYLSIFWISSKFLGHGVLQSDLLPNPGSTYHLFFVWLSMLFDYSDPGFLLCEKGTVTLAGRIKWENACTVLGRMQLKGSIWSGEAKLKKETIGNIAEIIISIHLSIICLLLLPLHFLTTVKIDVVWHLFILRTFTTVKMISISITPKFPGALL